MGANYCCSFFGSAMAGTETEESKVVSKSESMWSGFKRHIKRKSKNRSYIRSPLSNYTVEISPTYLSSRESKALLARIVSILRLVKRTLIDCKFDAAEIKLKLQAAEILVKSCEPEVCTEELPPKQISEEEDVVAVKMSDRWSWVRVAKTFRFPKATVFHGNRPKVSQDSIPGPIDQPSKLSRSSSTAVNSKSRKLWKFINFLGKMNSHGSKRQGIISATLLKLPRPDMNNAASNSQPNMSAERKGSITGDATGEGEDYRMATNLSVLIIIMACLVLFSSKLLAVVCASIWWYLRRRLLRNISVSAAAEGVKSDSSDPKHEKK